MRRLYLGIILALLIAGCAEQTAPPAPMPPPKPPPKPPPPVLSPQVGDTEENRLAEQTRARIDGTERIVRQIDTTKLARDQHETLMTIQSFVAKAKEALSTRDLQRAFNLADKAKVLADELSRAVR